jgi:hypothetical protein
MPNSERVENLVSVADTLTHKSPLHRQLELEPVVGFALNSTIQCQ